MRCIPLVILMVLAFPAWGQNMSAADKPIDITADKTLEWHRNDNRYIASGHVVIVQGDVTIRAAQVIADYREAKGGTEIYRLTADGDVSIDNGGNIATGDHLVYAVDSGIATMTGKALTLTAPDQKVTATQEFEYNVTKGTLKAVGDARAYRQGDTLAADTISATLKNDKDGKRSLDQLEASGNVVITTPAETLRGARGIYTASNSTAEITGGVTITRDQNVLSGERATVNLASNVSKLYAAENSLDPAGGRVRGTFYPGKKTP